MKKKIIYHKTTMTKRETIKKAKELCAEFSKMSEWKPGLSNLEKECWYTLVALIDYVEKSRIKTK